MVAALMIVCLCFFAIKIMLYRCPSHARDLNRACTVIFRAAIPGTVVQRAIANVVIALAVCMIANHLLNHAGVWWTVICGNLFATTCNSPVLQSGSWQKVAFDTQMWMSTHCTELLFVVGALGCQPILKHIDRGHQRCVRISLVTRCRSCGYPITSSEPVCPECGRLSPSNVDVTYRRELFGRVRILRLISVAAVSCICFEASQVPIAVAYHRLLAEQASRSQSDNWRTDYAARGWSTAGRTIAVVQTGVRYQIGESLTFVTFKEIPLTAIVCEVEIGGELRKHNFNANPVDVTPSRDIVPVIRIGDIVMKVTGRADASEDVCVPQGCIVVTFLDCRRPLRVARSSTTLKTRQ